jgi:hypothetical protein
MSKTIGDLTLNQVKEIKHRCGNYRNCKECKEKDKLCSTICDVVNFIDTDLLEQEIEVEEDDKKD